LGTVNKNQIHAGQAFITGESKMASTATKPRPANVPEENVYEKTHWLLLLTYIVAAGAVYLLVASAG